MLFSENIREPTQAGRFYPQDPHVLRQDIEKYLVEAEVEPLAGKVAGIIVPHAGYVFSGQVAAHAFKTLMEVNVKDTLLIGPSHHASFRSIAAYPKGAFRTPLGDVHINKNLSEQYINDYEEVSCLLDPHISEHSLEVELPFLQVVQPDSRIIPLLVGFNEEKVILTLSEIISSFLQGEDRVVVVSVDLSHFYSYDIAVNLDQKGLEAIININPELFWNRVENKETEIDAPGAVYALLKACKKLGGISAKLLKYANSGDVSGDMSSVVGYSAVVFYYS